MTLTQQLLYEVSLRHWSSSVYRLFGPEGIWKALEVSGKKAAIIAMPFDKPLKSPPVFPCRLSRLGYVSLALGKDLLHIFCFKPFNRSYFGVPKRQGQSTIFLIRQFNVLRPDDIAAQHSRSTDDSFQFSDITGPLV